MAATKEIKNLGIDATSKQAKKIFAKHAAAEVTKAGGSKGMHKLATDLAITTEKDAVGKFVAKKAKSLVAGAEKKAAKAKVTSMTMKHPFDANREMVLSMLKKEGSVVSRAARKVFGKTDPLTRMFAAKSFAQSLRQSADRNENGFYAIGRAIAAFGSTNYI